MVSRIISGAVVGVDGHLIEVEADLSNGLAAFEIVGLPDSAVKEARERVRMAIKNAGLSFPAKRVVINLAPADMRKEGPSFDLPIAIAILRCMGVIKGTAADSTFFAAELSLDGQLRPVTGILPMVYGAYQRGITHFVVPPLNVNEATLVEGAHIVGPRDLKELIGHLNGNSLPDCVIDREALAKNQPVEELDFSHVRGQAQVKRALEVAAAGGHNVLMIGPPGSGKTMMAKRLPSILPDLSFPESIEVTKIYSVAGLVSNKNALMVKRPFRAPHHTTSDAALTGGGKFPRPGEISLAHNGVLFLDELPEFHKNALEVLRQPLEEGSVTISRVAGKVTYPSDFMLVAAMNPCPCGYFGDSRCRCNMNDIAKYLGRISGPLLDRIDIHVEALRVNYEDLGRHKEGESSETIKARVFSARQIQSKRYQAEGIELNAQLSAPQTEKFCVLDKPGQTMLKNAFDRMGMSARAYHKLLKLARTIADLEGSDHINTIHLSEALQYRSLDRKYWI